MADPVASHCPRCGQPVWACYDGSFTYKKYEPRLVAQDPIARLAACVRALDGEDWERVFQITEPPIRREYGIPFNGIVRLALDSLALDSLADMGEK